MERPTSNLHTGKGRLRWAFDFASQDLPTREGDWLNLRDDLETFLYGRGTDRSPARLSTLAELGGFMVDAMETREALEAFTHADYGALQSAIRTLLEAFAPSTEPKVVRQPTLKTGPLRWRVLRPLPVLYIEGALRDLVLLKVWNLVQVFGTNRVHRCPECKRPFLKVGRRKFCGTGCAYQAWLKTPKGRTRAAREAKAAKERRAYHRKHPAAKRRKS